MYLSLGATGPESENIGVLTCEKCLFSVCFFALPISTEISAFVPSLGWVLMGPEC